MKGLREIKGIWESVRRSGHFHNFLVFLVFVAIATLFWFMMAMNDSIQREFNVRIEIENVPDSVTFITLPPASFHVSVRDQGTSLLRNGLMRTPAMHINFRDYADKDVLRFTPSDLRASFKGIFGKSATLLSSSMDSLRLDYTTGKGKRVPVVVSADVHAAPGSAIIGSVVCKPTRVTVYGPSRILDTVHRVCTDRLVKQNIREPYRTGIQLRPIAGTRIKPDKVEVTVNAEPLVRKGQTVRITSINVPNGLNLVLFPSQATVEYYVPMSKFGETDAPVEVYVDYDELKLSQNGMVGLKFGILPGGIVQPTLMTDSVEYSVVR